MGYAILDGMARTSILTGLALIVVGIVVTVGSDSESVTSMIPAFVGIVFVLLGLAARLKPSANHHLMHAAAALSLLAILGSLGSLIGRGAEGWALAAQLLTIGISAIFLALAIQSFRAARLARQSESA